MLRRRDTLLGALALGACAPLAPGVAYTPPPDDARFAEIEQRIGGRVGVAALNTRTGDWLGRRIQERFAMCSSFKWLLAAQHLHMDQEAPGWLAEIAQFGPGDMLPNSPVAQRHLARGYMSIEEMCEATVVASDNACANLLLTPAGGPAGLTRFLHAHGDGVTRLDRTETALNENLPGDPRDTSTPVAMVQTLQRFLLTDAVLNAASRETLIGWMEASTTGRDRLRGGVPTTWRGADKTGTSDDAHNATVDVAVLWPPDAAPIVAAVFLSGSAVDLPTRKAAHAEIGRIIAETWG